MEKVIKEIVGKSINAPSPDNYQPWRFRIVRNTLRVFSKPWESFLDYKRRGTYLTLGTLIENISITAKAYGYQSDIKLFPDHSDETIADIVFIENPTVSKDVLYESIPNRVTNRKQYDARALTEADRSYIKAAASIPGVTVKIIEDEAAKKVIFDATTCMEQVSLENEYLHKIFFDGIVWTEHEEHVKKEGLYLKTLELPKPVQIFFRLLRYWPVVKFLRSIGFPKKVAENNAKNYQSSAAVVFFCIPNTTPDYFVAAGRAVERVWLAATERGLGVQPLAGLVYMHQRIEEGNANDGVLSQAEIDLLTLRMQSLKTFIPSSDTLLVMILRIGYTTAPSARSSKKEPEFIT